MSTAYTSPASPGRRAARTVNHPEPAPISATFFPDVTPRMSITRLICSLSSRPGVSKIERSPVYGVLVLRVTVGLAAGAVDCKKVVAAQKAVVVHKIKERKRKRCLDVTCVPPGEIPRLVL